jgi:NADH-quinone oxidoreductase subunit G
MPQISFTIDGKKVTCEKGTMVLQAALDAGIFVPHYCYHPALSVAGNCRMCMVEVVPKPPPNAPPGWKPPPQKPAIGCATEATEGMEVLSEKSSMAKAAREGVLEFLLANHPLDCPVCDQAGECDLQDFSFQFGRATSRFVEQKQVKHTKDFGPEVRLYGNRCINCTRCVRFSQEISGGAEICQVNRGDHNIVDIFPGMKFDNALSGNVVDICPVGALVSRDFLHKARVWQLDATPSVCPHCSTGCSIEVHTRDDEVQRLKPRLNPKVNGFWMCDMGRLGYGFVNEKSRLVRCEKNKEPASFQDAVATVARKLEDAGGHAFAVASAWLTNEELFLLTKLFPKDHIVTIFRDGWEEQRFFPKWGDSLRNPSLPGQQGRGKMFDDGATFVIEEDRNPNRRGAERVLGADACSEEDFMGFLDACDRGEVKALLLVSGMPDYRPPERLLKAIEKVPFVAVSDILPGPFVDRAHVVLPGATFAEKEGTFTNGRGTTQRFLFARPAPGMARPELETLHAIAAKLGKVKGFAAADATFAEIAASVAEFKDMTWEGALHKSPSWSPHYMAHEPAVPHAPGAPPVHAREEAAKA